MRTIPLILLLGCGPVTATVLPITDLPDADTDTDTDTDTDSDTDTDTDSDTDTDTDPGPPPEIVSWDGLREFDFRSCEATVEEEGVRLLAGPQLDACPQCDFVFEIRVSPDRICGAQVQTEAFRGVELQERAIIHNIRPRQGQWVVEELGRGPYVQTGFDYEIEYSYGGNLGGGNTFEVEGELRLLAE